MHPFHKYLWLVCYVQNNIQGIGDATKGKPNGKLSFPGTCTQDNKHKPLTVGECYWKENIDVSF